MSVIIIFLGRISLHLTSEPESSTGAYCYGPITFTCVCYYNGGGLFWLIDNKETAFYVVRLSDVHPYPLYWRGSPIEGLTALAVDGVVRNPPDFRSFNVTITLSTKNVSMLNGKTVQCAEAFLESNKFHVTSRNPAGKLIILV